jgi:hypothetical protein
VFARVRFSPWAVQNPDYLLIWATIRNRDRVVKIQGYSVDRDTAGGREYSVGPEIVNYNLMKFLTSKNDLELEIARELVHRQVFCLKYPAEPLDTIGDELSPLQHANLLDNTEAPARLKALQSVASVIEIARGRLMCDSPLTDQIDGVLDQVRGALQAFARQTPTPTVAPRPSRLDPPPKAVAPPVPARPNT